MYADLHLHSTYSDGTDTPHELCRLAKKHNLKVISITDHDSVDGQKALLETQIPESQMSETQIPQDIEIITGIEISPFANGKMQHILGYYIDIYNKKLERFIENISVEATESTRHNFEKARINNVFSYEWGRVLELNAGQPRLGGSAVVKAMSIDGYEVPGMGLWDMHYKCFLGGDEDYVRHTDYSAYDAIDMIKSAGGVPVIAHPKNIGDDDIVLDLIRYGAQGLEVYHPSHSSEDSSKYLQMAEDKKLYITGGSDWHGKNSAAGRVLGLTGLPHDNYELLKLRNTQKQKISSDR